MGEGKNEISNYEEYGKMKYMIICTVALLVCFGIGFGITIPVRTRLNGKYRKLISMLLILLAGLVSFLVVMLLYLSIYYKADSSALDALEGNENVTVTKVDGGYLFDGSGDSAAMIFYPGAKVKETAYAPLLLEFAENGIDCFMAKMPLRMAVFGSNAADKFMKEYSYDDWILCGHSLGGTIAASYAEAHDDQVDGLVLLAAYPTKELSDELWMCSVYGSNDEVLGDAVYEKSKENWPSDSNELCIEGGNHAQFGEYGDQKGDGIAEISAEEQRQQTVEAVLDAINRNEDND